MKDPFTNEEFEPKRKNQRFANSKNRIDYHNMKANKLRREKASVDKPLNTNFKILNDIMKGKKKAEFHKEFLRGKGYDFKIYTGLCEVETNRGYCIYNFILTYTESYVKIIRNN
ncbi:hypothetical protein [Psychroflexus planctonicus]|uniref:Uncharacterized protein n=1 Tax=Psychroflexus planctonicus TaxID=1526575 RepID=A0ABQ1SKZ6_9FLAO|nr:hypothetical protein [Psychroflexus planctonicus]GGE44414.1 hypothetical protein GCM10010832_25550 [Psychroflexus planctonicus]